VAEDLSLDRGAMGQAIYSVSTGKIKKNITALKVENDF
jgi:hypothetical protein